MFAPSNADANYPLGEQQGWEASVTLKSTNPPEPLDATILGMGSAEARTEHMMLMWNQHILTSKASKEYTWIKE